MSDLKRILNKYTSRFLEQIERYSNKDNDRHYSNKSGGFPIFYDNRTYNEQSAFEERIENFIWRHLVNDVLKEMFSADYCSLRKIQCEWRRINLQCASSYVDKIESLYPYEFIISDKGRRIGYRYTNCYWLEKIMESVLKDNHLDELRIIDFSSPDTSTFLHPLIASKKYSSIVTKVTIEDFFIEYFSKEDYDLYLQTVKEAVGQAYRYVGFQSISNLTSQHLPYFIQNTFRFLELSALPFQTYTIFKPSNLRKEIKEILDDPLNHISAEDYKEFDRLFYGEKRYLALCGKDAFAHSFITSEYLYKTLRSNNEFDYTSIVSGYLKSVEQLLFRIESYLLNDLPPEQLWIKCRPHRNDKRDIFSNDVNGRKSRHVRFKPEYENHFDTTFISLVNLIGDYESGWVISEGGRKLVITYLQIYCSECRNEHFHKDNINDPKEVDIIRQNTILLFYYVLGGFRFYGKKDKDYQVLGIVNRVYEDMYHAIMKKSNGGEYFIITFEDSSPMLTALPLNHGIPIYDENGSMINPSLRFVRIDRDVVDDWHDDNWCIIEEDIQSEKNIYVTPDNLPIKIQYVDKMSGEKKDVEW